MSLFPDVSGEDEKLHFFREGQFFPWFTKLENFSNQIIAIKKKNQTWKCIRTTHVINGIGLRKQENYYRVKSPPDDCSPLTHKSITSPGTFWNVD